MTNVQLIPVIEITHYGQDIPHPENGPWWEFPDAYEDYRRRANAVVGYSEQLMPLENTFALYPISGLSDEDLRVLLQQEKAGAVNDHDEFDADLVCALSGGFVLQIDGKNVLFPQCCGDLADISSWTDLLDGKAQYFYQGHPQPRVTITNGVVRFEMPEAEYNELERGVVEVSLNELRPAIEAAVEQLDEFGKRLVCVNTEHRLGIPDLVNKLLHEGAAPRTVSWKSTAYRSVEHCVIESIPGGYEIRSVIEGTAGTVQYTIHTDHDWNTQWFELNSAAQTLSGVRTNDRWSIDGTERPEFDGCTEIDISLTPFTNSLPVKRLQLKPGDREVIAVLYIDVEENSLRREEQVYEKLSPLTWRFQTVPPDFEAVITLDASGLVSDYPGLFEQAEG